MTTNVVVETDKGSDIYAFTDAVLTNFDPADTDKVIFGATYIAVTGPDGNKFNLKGTFEYRGDTPSFENLKSGIVTSMTLVENPGVKHYAKFNNLSLDAKTVLDVMQNGTTKDLFALTGAMEYVGNAGDDLFETSLLDDVVLGGAGDDILSADSGNDLVDGGTGADMMSGGLGIDTLIYKNSAAKVTVSLIDDFADGGDATGDRFSGFENITGSDFSDILKGNNGANVLLGGQGVDILWGGNGADTLDGGSGDDTADYTGSGAIAINLELGLATGSHATGDVLTQIENVIGGSGRDIIIGNNAANVLKGGGNNDTLEGGVNSDKLDGNSGDDRLVGGQGTDQVIGNGGHDTFVLANLESSADTVKDFVAGSDVIEIDADLFGGDLLAGVDLTAAQLEINRDGLASTKDVQFIFNSRTGELFFDSNGSGGGTIGSRLIATFMGGVKSLAVDDFSIV